ncbi:ABC transporter permease [Terriglobus sp. TAA 43]|uniref:ABC transporter permease n=1 Tax=Terriglobus sp. TAA 43 TaxID=278961 RepID=UPI000647DE6C|nr:ABC transporter permease [Terriglobus sp. TAA 43]
MHWITKLVIGLKSLLQKDRVERELDEELESYLDASTAHKQNSGMTAEEARRAAVIEIGSRNAVKHHVWSSRWESVLEELVQDFRLSVRMLVKSPGFAAIALLSLALGIGANTAIFTLINQVMLRNLPVPHPEQLVTFGDAENSGIAAGIDIGAYGLFPWYFARQLEAQPGPFQGIASFGSFANEVSVMLPSSDVAPISNSSAILVRTSLVSGNYFSVLGAQPFMGRAISTLDDAMPGAGAVVVISHHFWEQSLSSDPSILGRFMSINGTPFQIIGVMPEAFHGMKRQLEPPDLWAPISMQAVVLKHPSLLLPAGTAGGTYFLNVFGRLSDQASTNKSSLAQTQAWLDQQIRVGLRAIEGTKLSASLEQEINHVTVPLVSTSRGVSLVRSQYGDSLRILMGVVILVLLIACANLANFLLARSATRQREIATRLALGSTRARIIRQGLMETFLLSVIGGTLGLAVAFAATRSLIAFVSQGSSYIAMSPTPDATVLLFTLGVSLFTGILFGLAPAVIASRTEASGNLTTGAHTALSSGGKLARLWPKALVAAQVMLSLLLLVSAGLFLRTLSNLENQDYGFERSQLLLAEFSASLAGYKPSQSPGLHQQLLDRLSALPGVKSVALAATAPISGGNWSSDIAIPGYIPAPKESMNSKLNRISGRYFETADIRIVAGRAINETDTASRQKVAVINQAIAKHFFPKGDAIGRSLSIGISDVKGPWQIVGIARDTKAGDPRSSEPLRMTYIPLAQIEPFNPVDPSAKAANPPVAPEENQDRVANLILLRTTGNPANTVADLRAAVKSIDPNLPLTKITTIRDEIDDFISHDQLVSTLTSLFAGLALLLAAIGLYGVMSYNVVCRRNEIGIRLALGAQTLRIQWMILNESLLLLAIGVGVGLPLTLLATRWIKAQLFGLSALDPMSFAAALTVVSVMTLLAAWLPTRRATQIEPMSAVRCE